MIAEGDHHLPVLARIGIGDGGNLRRADRLPRVGQQRAVQRALGGTGVRRRRDLRPRQIGLQELIGDEQPAARIAIEQMMAAGQPEVARLAHVRSPFAIVMRSTCSCRRLLFADDLQECIGAQWFGPDARGQRAKRLADRTVLVFARHRGQHALGMVAERSRKGDLLLGRGTRGRKIGRAEVLDQPLRQQFDGARAVLVRSPPRSAPASTSRASRCRESPSEMRRAPCLPARSHPDARTRTPPAPPIRRARPPARTRRYRRDRAGWCAEASCARPSGCRVEPRRRCERGGKSVPVGLLLAAPPHQQIAIAVERGNSALLERQVIAGTSASPWRIRWPARRRWRPSGGARSFRPAGRTRDRRSLPRRARSPADASRPPLRPWQPCGWWRRTPAIPAARSRSLLPARPAARRRSTRHRPGWHRARRRLSAAPAARAPAARRGAPPCRRRTRAAPSAAALPARARPRIPTRSKRPTCTSVPAPASAAMALACANASPTSLSVTRRKGGGRSSAGAGEVRVRLCISTGTMSSRIGASSLGRL